MDYKEYLDKARIKQLAELQARYNQVYAKERAEAASSLIAGHRQLRRGLQNVGLAGRKGNLISGREKTAALEARRRYREYNAGLSRAANTFTTAAGQRMARQAIDDENRVKRAEAYAKWGDEYAAAKAEAEKEYAAKLEEAKQEHLQYAQEYQNSYNAYLAHQAQYQAWLQQQAAAQAAQQGAQQELIDPRFQGNNMQQQKQDMLAARSDQQRLQAEIQRIQMQQMAQDGVDPRLSGAQNTQQAKLQAASAARLNTLQRQYASLQEKIQRAEGITKPQNRNEYEIWRDAQNAQAKLNEQAQYAANMQKWQATINQAANITKPKNRYENEALKEAELARQKMAKAQAEMARKEMASKVTGMAGVLLQLSDEEFKLRYDAAERAYKLALQNAKILRQDSSSSMDDLSSDADRIEAQATQNFVAFEQANALREQVSEGNLYWNTFKPDAHNEYNKPSVRLIGNLNKGEFQTPIRTQDYLNAVKEYNPQAYNKMHDTDSKYAAAIHEYGRLGVLDSMNVSDQARDLLDYDETFLGKALRHSYADAYDVAMALVMTDEEKNRFDSFLANGQDDKADKYFEYLRDSGILDARAMQLMGNRLQAGIKDEIEKNGKLGLILSTLWTIPANVANGLIQPIASMFDTNASPYQATIRDLPNVMREAVSQNLSQGGAFAYQTGMSIGDSLMSMALGGRVGGVALGGAAYNSAYREALNRGLSTEEARLTAFGTGFNEMLFETLSIGTLLEKTGKSAIKASRSAFVNWLVNTAVQAGVEGSEEVFTDIANNLWDKSVNGIVSEELTSIREYMSQGMTLQQAKAKVQREHAMQLGMSFLGGALSGGVMAGVGQGVNAFMNRRIDNYGKQIVNGEADVDINTLEKFDYKSEQAQEILNSGKLTNTDYGMLAILRVQELVQRSEAYINQAVAEGKMPQEIADIYKKFAEHNVQTETNPDGITDEEAEKMLPYVDTIKNAEAIKQGLGKIVEQQTAARKEFDALSPEQKQQRLQTITNETTALRNAPSLRVGARESRLSGQSAAQEFTTRAKTDTITLNNDGSVKTANGSVTFDFGANKTVDAMTDNQARAIRFAAAVANKTGVNIKVEQEFVGDDRNKNGEYNPETNTIRVNLSGTNSAIYTMSHELTHYLQTNNKQAFSDLSKAIQKQLSRTDLVGSDLPADYQDIIGDYLTGDNTLWQALCAYEKERYAKEKINLTQEKVEEEVIARCCESFLGNSSLVADMTQNHTKSARAVYRFLSEIRADINALRADASERMAERGYASDFSPEQGMLEQFADIDKIVKLWENGLRKVAKKNKVSGEKLYSLQEVEPVQPKSNKWQRTIDTAEAKRRFPTLWDVTADESEVRNPTQIKSTVSTYRKIYNMLKAEGFDGTILDASSGLGYGTKAGQEEYGFNVDDIEPYPDASYKPKYTDYSKLNKKYDVIISNAVLNVIPQDQRDALVVKMGDMLKNGGRIFINTRSKDVDTLASNKRNTKIGNMEWFVADTGSYQKGFTPNELQAYVQDVLGDGFTVERSNKFGAAAVIVTKKSTMASLSDTENEDIRYSLTDNVKLSSVDSPVVNRIADESFPIQPKTNREEVKYEKTVAHDTKVRLADIQDSMFHPVMRSIKDAVPISERTLAKARSMKEIPYNISLYENTEKAIVDLAKFIKENYSGKYDVQGNLLLPEETVQSNNIFSNASYLKDAEPTTECYRQTIYRAFLKVVTDQLGRPVTEREAIIVNQACIEIGLDAPCIYCYSLLDRKAKEGYKLQYLAERDAFLAKIDEEYHGDIEAFKRDRAKNFDRYNEMYLSRVTDPAAYKDGVYDKSMARKGNAAKVDRVKLWLDVYENGYHDGTMITANDVRNIEAEEASLKEAKGNSLRTRELKDILYWAQSASQAKKIIPYSAYTNDGRRSILSWNQNTIDALNREYGLRWYSHADFHPAFIVDNMQQIMDASVKGLKGLMYVKPVEAAKIFAPTGMLINVSCFAQYKNGQYVADDRMGADWTEVQNLRKQYENVGAVMVVTTDDMWMWAMTQDWVDVIIPLHLVRSGSEFVDTFGLHNYSEEQADKLVGKAAKEKYEAFIADLAAQQEKTLSDKEVNALKKANKSIYPGEHENDYAKYMEACEKRGLTPRFDRMRQLIEEGGMSWGGKEITLQDYMKCVSETRMPYTKAQTLKPSFDFDAAKQTAATLPEKGFFNYFKQSSEWNGKTMTMQDWVNQAVADINAKKDPSKLGYGRDLAVDESGKYLEIGTRAEAKRRGVGGIHDTRSSIIRQTDKKASLAVPEATLGESLGKDYLKYLQLGTKVVNQTATEDEIRDFKQRMNTLSQDNREAFLDKLREKLIRDDEGAKVREVRDRQIAALKEELKQARERRAADREARKRDDIKRKIQKGSAKITQMLAHPTEARHVPVPLAKEVIEFMTMLNDFMNATVKKDAAEPMTKRGKAIAEKLKQVYDESFTDQETIKKAQEENPEYNPLGNKINEAFKDIMLSDMIKVVGDVISEKSVDNLTSDELDLINQVLRGVTRTVLDANKLVQSQIKADAQEAGLEMMGDLRYSPRIKNRSVRYFLEESLSLRRLALAFSNSDENSVFVRLVNELNDGAIEKERIATALQNLFNPVMETYGKEIRKWYGKDAEWINTGVVYDGQEVRITKGMRVSLALHYLNDGNMKHIKNGGVVIPDETLYKKGKTSEAYSNEDGRHIVRLSEEDISMITMNMTEAEKEYLRVAKEFFHNRTGYYINRTSLATVGFRKAMVKNYFPIHTDSMFRIQDLAQYFMDNGSVENQGFLKDRVSGTNPILLEDITSVVNRQINGVSLYAGLAPAIRNWNAVMNTQEWVKVIENDEETGEERKVWRPNSSLRSTMMTVMGKNGYDVVMQFIKDVQEQTHEQTTPLDKFIGRMSTNYVKAVLLGNMKVALKQVASVPTAAYVIPWKYIGKAIDFKAVDVDVMHEYAPLYGIREAGRSTEIGHVMQKEDIEMRFPKIFGWMTAMDKWAVRRIWRAAEYMVQDQNPDIPVGSDEFYKAVNKIWTKAIQETQPNFTPLQRADALRLTRGKYSTLARPLVMFGTQRMQNGGILIESYLELVHSKGKSKEAKRIARMKFGRAVASQIVQNFLLVLMSLAVDALRGRMRGWQDKDDNIDAKSIAWNAADMYLSNLAGSFLGGSEVYNSFSYIVKRLTGNKGYESEFENPSLDAIQSIVNYVENLPLAIQYLMGDHKDEEKLKKAINMSLELAKVAGYATGIPFENAAKDIVNGIIPAVKDHIDIFRTGEISQWWLHQSGKLDKAKTAANYKAWTKAGYSGRDYFYWEKQLNGVSGGRDGRIPILLDSDLTNEQKALMMQMFDTADGYADGTVFYNKKGEAIIDFTAPTEKQQALPKPSAEPSEAPNAEPTAEPTPKPTENPLTEARQEGVQAAVKLGVPEQTAFDAFLAYQNMGKNKDESDGYSRNDEFREWLFKNVDSPEQMAVLEYQVIGQASSVKGAITYRDSGVVYRDYTNESWFKLSEHNLAKDGTNKRYEAGKQLEKTGLNVDKTVAIYDGLKELTKKAEWIDYLKNQNLNDDQIRIFLWSRGWKY